MTAVRIRLVSLVLVAAGALGVRAVEASPIIINLDGHVNYFFGGDVVVHFDAGTYLVTPIGVADGGAFDAFSAWPSNIGCCLHSFESA